MTPKITLLRTPAVIPASSMNGSSIVPSLALGYLSGVLKDEDCEVFILDAQVEAIGQLNPIEGVDNYITHGLNDDAILSQIPVDTDVLAVSIMFSSEWPYVRELIRKIKNKFPHLFILAGGEHITAVPDFTLKQCCEIDIGVLGEGEETIVELIEHYKNPEMWKNINGIVYKSDGIVRSTLPRKRIKKVDEIPWPLWDDESLQKFFDSKQSHGPYKGRTMPIMASRGCPYDCQFCSNKTMWGINYYSRNPKDVVDEIESYVNKYQIKCFEFMDLTVYMKRTWIIDFCKELIERKLDVTWQCTGGTRTEAINEEVIVLTKQAGCTYLGFAPESGSEKVLIDIKKKIKLDRMMTLYKLMRRHNVGTRANLIIGFPDETRTDIFLTIWLQIKLAFLGVLDAPLFIFTPYPGSGFFRLLIQRKIIPDFKNTSQKELDSYFYDLAQDFGTVSGRGYNTRVGIKELRIYQTLGMGAFYTLQYIFYPMRILSFIKTVFFHHNESNSVFEQRISQNLNLLNSKKSK